MKNDWIWIGIVLILAIGLDLWLMPKLWRAGKRLKDWHPSLPKFLRFNRKTRGIAEPPQGEEAIVTESTVISPAMVEAEHPQPDSTELPIRLSLNIPPGAHLEISLRVKDNNEKGQAD